MGTTCDTGSQWEDRDGAKWPIRGPAAYEDHMCDKMDGEIWSQMLCVSPLIVIMTHNRDARESSLLVSLYSVTM